MTDAEKLIYDIVCKIDDKLTLQNGRIRKLENWRSYLAGAVAVAGTAIVILYK